MWHDAPLSLIQISLLLSLDYAANALGRKLLVNGLGTPAGTLLVEPLYRIPFEDTNSPGRQNWVITARSFENFQDESDGTGGPCGAGGADICCP